MLSKYSWLTPTIFAELYWTGVILAIFPASALFETYFWALAIYLLSLTLVLCVFLEQRALKFERAKEYRKNRQEEVETENKIRQEKINRGIKTELLPPLDFGPLKITSTPLIINALRDFTKYTITGGVCLGVGKLLRYLFTDLGIFSKVLSLASKIILLFFLKTCLVIGIVLLLLLIVDKITKFVRGRSI